MKRRTHLLNVAFFLILVGAWLHLPAMAASEARTAIEAGYDKTCEAARLHFLDGIVSIRADDFEAYTPEGKNLDLSGERHRYEFLFENALSVQKTYEILSFAPLGPDRAECEVHETYRVEKLDPGTRGVVEFWFESWSRDEWVNTPRGWRIQRSHVTRQVAGPR